MNDSKMREFHIPFLHGLVIVGLVTIVSMISSRYIVSYILSHPSESIHYTSQESQIKP
jgi:hypothetical protein